MAELAEAQAWGDQAQSMPNKGRGHGVRSFTGRPVSGRYGIVVDAAAIPGNAKSAVRVE
jgi:hypothetical protein